MQYEEFLEKTGEVIQKREGDKVRVKIACYLKNNRGKLKGLAILEEGVNTAPAMYLDQYYHRFLQGESLEYLAEEILAEYRDYGRMGCLDMSFYTDYAKACGKIVCRLVNYEKNRDMFSEIPYTRFLDLAIVYYYRVDDGAIGKGSILVQNVHLETWGVDLEELHDAAVTNTVRRLPYECIDIADMLHEMLGMELSPELQKELPMYVLTNTEKYYGAVNIIYDSILEAIGEKLETDFYILPSSIHECIIVPALEGLEESDLQKMVKEINKEYVDPEEVLGDSVYRYDLCEKRIRITEKSTVGNIRTKKGNQSMIAFPL